MASKQRSIALIYGLTAGLALIGYTLLLYHNGVDAYLGMAARLGYLIIFALAAAAAIAEKKAGDGYIDFRTALKAAFTVIVISLALQSLVIYILMNHVDIPFRELVDKEAMRRQVEFWRSRHYPEDQIDQWTADQKGQGLNTPRSVLFGLMLAYVICFIPAVLIAVIVKKKKQ